MSLKLNLKVLNDIKDDLSRVESQLVRFKDPAIQAKYREEVEKLKESADRLYKHYKIVLEAQK